jgi:surface polysaccharide O-acyltransferase-like enzyme
VKIHSIEVARAVAIFCVVLIHTEPFLRQPEIKNYWYYFGQIIQQISSFAVPFFFIVAGYFFSLGIDKQGLKKQLNRYFLRILLLLLTWVIIDGIFWGEWLKSIIENGSLRPLLWNIMAVPSFAINRPDLFLFRGTAVPLWFLVSLLGGILLLSIFVYAKLNKFTILAVGSVAYLFSLTVSFYSHTSIGLGFIIPLEQRGVFISIFFISIGYFLANSQININGFNLLIISTVLMFIESTALSMSQNIVFIEHPYLFSTALVPMGIFLTAIQNPGFGVNSFIHKIGLLSLGIYVVHTPVLGALNYYRDFLKNPMWELFFPIVTLFLSILIVSLFRRVPYLRKVVV